MKSHKTSRLCGLGDLRTAASAAVFAFTGLTGLTGLVAASPAQTVIFSDDFNNQTTATKTRPDGAFVGASETLKWHGGWSNNSSGSTSNVDSSFSAGNATYTNSTCLYSYLLSTAYTSYYVDADLDTYENYDLNIGYLRIESKGSVTLNARATYTNGVAVNGGYQITYSNTFTGDGAPGVAAYRIQYFDTNSGTATLLGYITGTTALVNVSIEVRGNQQKLSINGIDYGVVTTTQGVYDNSTADYFSMVLRADQGAVAGIRFDDISVVIATVAVPEPATASLFLGLAVPGAVSALLAIRRATRRRVN
ncbi:MAG: hypothetical protein LBK99_08910 [Opitutaceae bacterium]|jgi:hypothetical protein|nr:hypothetical protein [Opitutaceae bacterium]